MSLKSHNKEKIAPPFSLQHVAIIMDGNGRWAKNKGKPRILGHKAGIKSVRKAINFSLDHHFNALTLYAFSSENWNRPIQEVSALMKLFEQALDKEVQNLHKHNIRLRVIGDTSRFSVNLQDRIFRSETLTQNNNGLTLNIAANYGGRWDIMQGVKKIITQVQRGILPSDQINESTLCQFICMNDLAPVDLVIRTGGEHRMSNFLLWQIAYAELFFTDILWPDFNDSSFEEVLHNFAQRKRRFGKITPNNTDT